MLLFIISIEIIFMNMNSFDYTYEIYIYTYIIYAFHFSIFYIGCGLTQDASHHQDYYSLEGGIPNHRRFARYWEGGHIQYIWYLDSQTHILYIHVFLMYPVIVRRTSKASWHCIKCWEPSSSACFVVVHRFIVLWPTQKYHPQRTFCAFMDIFQAPSFQGRLEKV